ncbi:UDP-4-amino-4,6-dideoxy-N-acetyl-beta-L-altrosamine N-acetyltransferase [Candidatus Beckwithbacteria bacterium]|nr:UDP-4-amino-4,6-dideoxy-N-acetyl-beta-L-altrosamine N-acetyltransferase [Candidatus Beckwithbacteria bacterium]
MKKVIFYEQLELKSFVVLTKNEKQLVYQWRNNQKISKWMINQNKFSYTEHLRFIKKLAKDNNNFHWLVQNKIDKEYLGVCNLVNIDKKHKHCYLGIYVNPSLQNKGYGTDILKVLKHIAYNLLNIHTIKLEVFEHNSRAINFYKKNGFKKEGLLKDYILINNKWHNLLLMGHFPK